DRFYPSLHRGGIIELLVEAAGDGLARDHVARASGGRNIGRRPRYDGVVEHALGHDSGPDAVGLDLQGLELAGLRLDLLPADDLVGRLYPLESVLRVRIVLGVIQSPGFADVERKLQRPIDDRLRAIDAARTPPVDRNQRLGRGLRRTRRLERDQHFV